jgi:hypothetical protein
MKQAKYLLLATLFAPSAFAEGMQIKAKVIGSEGRLDISKTEASVGGFKLDFNSTEEADSSRQTATGFGAAVEFPMGDPLRLGVEVSYVPFKDDGGDEAYEDLAWGGYASFDFLNQDVLALYGIAGIGFHNVQLADRKVGAYTLSYDSTGLLNYELGIGSRFRLNSNLDFALELHRSDTFSRNDIDVDVEGLSLVGAGLKYKDVALTKNEAVASLNFSF